MPLAPLISCTSFQSDLLGYNSLLNSLIDVPIGMALALARKACPKTHRTSSCVAWTRRMVAQLPRIVDVFRGALRRRTGLRVLWDLASNLRAVASGLSPDVRTWHGYFGHPRLLRGRTPLSSRCCHLCHLLLGVRSSPRLFKMLALGSSSSSLAGGISACHKSATRQFCLRNQKSKGKTALFQKSFCIVVEVSLPEWVIPFFVHKLVDLGKVDQSWT